MKNNIISSAFLICTLLITNNSFAADWDNGGISNVKIKSIVTLIDGAFYFHTDKDLCDGGAENKVGYVHNNLKVSTIDWSKEGSNMLLKVALSAKLSGKLVRVYADDSGSKWGCRVGAIALQ